MAAIYKRKNSRGQIRWRALIRRKGHRQISATFASKTKAAAWAKKMEDDVAGGRFIRRSMIDHLTYKDAFEKRLIEENLDPKDSTVRRAEWWAHPKRLGSIRLADITRSDIERCIHELRSTPKLLGGFNIRESNQRRSEATITRYITSLSAVLQHYVDPEEGLPYNPARRIKRKKPTEQPLRYYTEAQVKAVLDACKQSTYERLHFLAVCALVTGARRSELLNLRWNQVNLERGEAYLDPEQAKTKRARVIIFAGPALEELRCWARRGGRLLFPSPKNPEKPVVGIPRLFARALQTARIELKDSEFRMRWHDWRHMCATYLSLNGCNAFMVAEILGHSSIAMTQRYQNLTTDSRREVLEEVFG